MSVSAHPQLAETPKPLRGRDSADKSVTGQDRQKQRARDRRRKARGTFWRERASGSPASAKSSGEWHAPNLAYGRRNRQDSFAHCERLREPGNPIFLSGLRCEASRRQTTAIRHLEDKQIAYEDNAKQTATRKCLSTAGINYTNSKIPRENHGISIVPEPHEPICRRRHSGRLDLYHTTEAMRDSNRWSHIQYAT